MKHLKNFFLKLKGSSLTNIIGLSIGIAASITILLYVKYEQSYDKHNEQFNNIYRIRTITQRPGADVFDAILTPPAFARTVKNECPEIKNIVRFFPQSEMMIKVEEQQFEEDKVTYVDSTYFDIFTTPLIQGDKNTCLTRPYTAVLSESTAKKYFGNINPVGKIFYHQKDAITVTGVYKDMPLNSHFKFNIMLSYYTPNWLNKGFENAWNNFFLKTYFTVNKNVDISTLEEKITAIYEKNRSEKNKDEKRTAIIQPLKDIHLYSNYRSEFEQNSSAKINIILTIVAFLILIIAWVNYVNLTTATSLDRAKEVGVKKVIGFYKRQLVKQFLVESLTLNGLAIIFAMVLVFFFQPIFSDLLGVSLSFKYWNIGFIILLIIVFICGTILSALYPAFIMSSFNPVDVLKGKIGTSSGGIGVRKALLMFQFFISALLIFLTIVVFQQTQYLLKTDLGIDIKNTLVVKGSNLENKDSLVIAFKDELITYPEFSTVTSANCLPANGDFLDNIWSDKQSDKDKKLFTVVFTDYNYIPGLEVKLIAGRNFSKDFPSDKNAVIISESGIKQLGFNDAEEALKFKTNREYGPKDRDMPIIGVVKDIKMGNLQKQSFPVIIYLKPNQKRFFAIKSKQELNQNTVATIKSVWKKHFGVELFRNFVLDESYNKLYTNEIRNSKVLALFSVLAIFVSIIGLWGLAYFSIKQRIKEIGIRKVLGFKVIDIVELINVDFLKLVGISCCIAIPLAWYLSIKWLENYANRIELQGWYFISPILAVALITTITISFYTIKAAISNPVEALRNE